VRDVGAKNAKWGGSNQCSITPPWPGQDSSMAVQSALREYLAIAWCSAQLPPASSGADCRRENWCHSHQNLVSKVHRSWYTIPDSKARGMTASAQKKKGHLGPTRPLLEAITDLLRGLSHRQVVLHIAAVPLVGLHDHAQREILRQSVGGGPPRLLEGRGTAKKVGACMPRSGFGNQGVWLSHES